MIRTVGMTLAAAGTAVGDDVVAGEVLGVHLTYGGAGTAVISTRHDPTVAILSATAGTAWYYPRAQVHDTAGAGLTLDGTRANVEAIPIVDQVQVVADDACSVTMIIRG